MYTTCIAFNDDRPGHSTRLLNSSFFSTKEKALDYAKRMAGIVAVSNSSNQLTWIRFNRFFNYAAQGD